MKLFKFFKRILKQKNQILFQIDDKEKVDKEIKKEIKEQSEEMKTLEKLNIRRGFETPKIKKDEILLDNTKILNLAREILYKHPEYLKLDKIFKLSNIPFDISDIESVMVRGPGHKKDKKKEKIFKEIGVTPKFKSMINSYFYNIKNFKPYISMEILKKDPLYELLEKADFSKLKYKNPDDKEYKVEKKKK